VKGVALSTTSNWLWNFVIGVHHSYMVVTDEGKLGAKVFFILGATCTASALSAYVFVPETKGLSPRQRACPWNRSIERWRRSVREISSNGYLIIHTPRTWGWRRVLMVRRNNMSKWAASFEGVQVCQIFNHNI
jgi:hypothetical protein